MLRRRCWIPNCPGLIRNAGGLRRIRRQQERRRRRGSPFCTHCRQAWRTLCNDYKDIFRRYRWTRKNGNVSIVLKRDETYPHPSRPVRLWRVDDIHGNPLLAFLLEQSDLSSLHTKDGYVWWNSQSSQVFRRFGSHDSPSEIRKSAHPPRRPVVHRNRPFGWKEEGPADAAAGTGTNGTSGGLKDLIVKNAHSRPISMQRKIQLKKADEPSSSRDGGGDSSLVDFWQALYYLDIHDNSSVDRFRRRHLAVISQLVPDLSLYTPSQRTLLEKLKVFF